MAPTCIKLNESGDFSNPKPWMRIGCMPPHVAMLTLA
jgi:hypothetical protein